MIGWSQCQLGRPTVWYKGARKLYRYFRFIKLSGYRRSFVCSIIYGSSLLTNCSNDGDISWERAVDLVMVELSLYCCSNASDAYWICSSAWYPSLLRTHCHVFLSSFLSLDDFPCFLSIHACPSSFASLSIKDSFRLQDSSRTTALPCLYLLVVSYDHLRHFGHLPWLSLCDWCCPPFVPLHFCSVPFSSSTLSDGLRLLFDLPDILEQRNISVGFQSVTLRYEQSFQAKIVTVRAPIGYR